MHPSNKDYKKLQKSWYSKLKAEGFQDIEHDENTLKYFGTVAFFRKRHNAVFSRAKEEYFRLAGQFLYDYPFKTPLDKTIWEMHSRGKGVREISAVLKKQKIVISKSSVNNLIRELREEMINKCR